MKIFQKIIAFIFLACVVGALGKSWHLVKGGFSIARVSPLFYEKEKESSLPKETLSLFDQSFKYLGRGRQCYAFESEDGKYVLKLPRFDHFKVPFWLKALSFSFWDVKREQVALDKMHRYHLLMKSFLISKDFLEKETGTLFVHIHPSKDLKRKVKIFDRMHRWFLLDLDKTSFALQTKTPLMIPLFFEYLKKGEDQKAKDILNAFLKVISQRAQKGIFNKDPTFLKNFGYDGKQVIQIDIGSFYFQKTPQTFESSFLGTVSLIRSWLQESSPQMISWFEKRVEQILEETKK